VFSGPTDNLSKKAACSRHKASFASFLLDLENGGDKFLRKVGFIFQKYKSPSIPL
jgi:hypothetical protein